MKTKARWVNKPSYLNAPCLLGVNFGRSKASKRGPRPSQVRPPSSQEACKSGFEKVPHFIYSFLMFFARFVGCIFDGFWYQFVDISLAMVLPLIYENIDFCVVFFEWYWYPTFYRESSLKYFCVKNGRQFGTHVWTLFSSILAWILIPKINENQ